MNKVVNKLQESLRRRDLRRLFGSLGPIDRASLKAWDLGYRAGYKQACLDNGAGDTGGQPRSRKEG